MTIARICYLIAGLLAAAAAYSFFQKSQLESDVFFAREKENRALAQASETNGTDEEEQFERGLLNETRDESDALSRASFNHERRGVLFVIFALVAAVAGFLAGWLRRNASPGANA